MQNPRPHSPRESPTPKSMATTTITADHRRSFSPIPAAPPIPPSTTTPSSTPPMAPPLQVFPRAFFFRLVTLISLISEISVLIFVRKCGFSVGSTERFVHVEASGGESSNAGTGNDSGNSSGSSSGQLDTGPKLTQSQSLALYLTRLFDEKIPFRKKLKHINRVATVTDNGTVQFDVPGDVKPHLLDFSNGVVYDEESSGAEDHNVPDVPPLQIVMLIVGTRGDVQPFVAIGKKLQEYGHRVRLATHANFKDFVCTAGLEFFPLGGDPKLLAEYMVKNNGFLSSGPSEVSIQRQQLKDIIFSLLPACKEPDPDTNVPFKAEAIIANPPAYGHSHVAEALKVPLHIFFTMPWTPTSEFPHPLSPVRQHIGYRIGGP